VKQFSVSIDISSDSLSLSQLTEQLGGVEPGPNSHEIGEPRPRGRVWDVTIWRLDSDIEEDASLEDHLRALLSDADEFKLFESAETLQDVERHLNVAVYFDSPMSSLVLPVDLIAPFVRAGFGVEVSAYPCSFEEERTEVGGE
jgi:hypothetical protein